MKNKNSRKPFQEEGKFGPGKRALYALLLTAAETVGAAASVSIWTTMTPALAAELIDQNPSNRNPSNAVIARYARDMTNGSWRESHQGLALGPDLQLGDGQHRCLAVMKSGVSVRVKFDWYRDAAAFELARHTWDQNRVRSKANILELTSAVEKGKGRHVSAVLESITQVDKRWPVHPSNEDMLHMFATMKTSIMATLALDHREFYGPARAAFAIAHAKCPAEIEACMKMMVTKANVPAGSAAQTILVKLKDIQSGQTGNFRLRNASRDKRAQVTRDLLSLLYRHCKGRAGVSVIRKSNRDAMEFFLGDNARGFEGDEE